MCYDKAVVLVVSDAQVKPAGTELVLVND